MRPEHLDCFVREDAIGASAVGDYLLAGVDVVQVGLKLGDGDRFGSRYVAGFVFLLGAHVEDDNFVVLEALEHVGGGDRLQGVPVFEEGVEDAVYFGQAGLAKLAYGSPGIVDPVVGEPVVGIEALAADFNEAGFAQGLQVLGSVGYRQGGLPGKVFDGALALSEQVYQLETVRVGEGFGDTSELLVHLVFESSMVSVAHIFNIILE